MATAIVEKVDTRVVTEAAQSVAEAVKKVADAAVAEVQKVKPAGSLPELTAVGLAGGKLVIEGAGFGHSGTVLLNGAQVPTYAWSTTHIEGRLPAAAKSGELVVWVDPETQRKGYLTL